MTEIKSVNEWLDTDLGIDIWKRKYQRNDEGFQDWLERVSGGNKDIKRLIAEKKFMFGGRTTANRGINNGASFSNCYTEGRVEDSMESIMDTSKNLSLTYKAQGGEGLSVTNIRPKGTPIGDSGFTSDGFLPFMEIFDTTTKAISQGGSRKGALLISCDALHKDALEFIKIKSDTDKITKANLSIEIDNDFMVAVEEFYKTGKKVVLSIKRTYGDHDVEYDVCPIEVYKTIMEHAYDFAEPGVLFMDKFRNYNLMEHIEEYVIDCCNACGEQPMVKYSSCNLSSFNTSEYVIDEKFDFDSFKRDIPTVVRAMDDVLDEGADRHALKEQREAVKKYRNIGIGIMGLGTMFIKMKIKYGSEESKILLSNIMEVLFTEAVRASSNLASERGSFELYSEAVFDSEIIRKHFGENEIATLKKQGLRGTSLISVAPTGSIGTLLGISTGIEPYFSFEYFRKTESLHGDKEKIYKVYDPIAKKYLEENNTDILPDYFVSSENINWRDRIEIQSIAQDSTDTAISSTVNLPKETTLEEIEQLYLYAWKMGLKGTTIFYSGGKKEGVLTTDENRFSEEAPHEIPWGTTIESSDDLLGRKRKIMTGCGSLHVQAWFDKIDGRLMEVYFSKGSEGGCNSFMNGLSRMMSGALRTGMDFDYAIDQLKSAPACPSYVARAVSKRDTSKGKACPDGVANALLDMQREIDAELGHDDGDNKKTTPVAIAISEPKEKYDTDKIEELDECPECKEKTVSPIGGCMTCANCGWSKCG